MKTTQAPTVGIDGLIDPAMPTAMQIPKTRVEMKGSGWLDWLERHDRFKFESPSGKFTAYKSGKGYWTAQRRVSSKLRHEYLGGSSDLIYETLDQAARKMDMGNSAYWREKYPDPRAEQKPNVESHKEKDYETVSESSSQTRAEIENLERQLAEAKNAIALLKRDVEYERNRADDAVLDGLRAATILKEALKFKSNNATPIKTRIKEALKLIDDI